MNNRNLSFIWSNSQYSRSVGDLWRFTEEKSAYVCVMDVECTLEAA